MNFSWSCKSLQSDLNQPPFDKRRGYCTPFKNMVNTCTVLYLSHHIPYILMINNFICKQDFRCICIKHAHSANLFCFSLKGTGRQWKAVFQTAFNCFSLTPLVWRIDKVYINTCWERWQYVWCPPWFVISSRMLMMFFCEVPLRYRKFRVSSKNISYKTIHWYKTKLLTHTDS